MASTAPPSNDDGTAVAVPLPGRPRPAPINTINTATGQPQQQDQELQPPVQVAVAAGQDGRPPSPEHEPLTWDMWWGRAWHLLFGPKKDPNPTGVAARKDFGWLVLGGSLLCFVSGWVNAFAIIAAASTVSHVTGSTTKAGMALAEADGAYMGFAFMIWACFVMGGAVSGIIIVKDTFAMGRGYGHAFLLISALLFIASVWVIHFPENDGYLFLLAMGMGTQNGLTTRYSGNVVRTTHMTGLSTDIGITIGHVLRCHPKPERWKLKMYFPMLICFFLGAAAGKSAFDARGRSSLLFPAFFLFFLGWGYIYYLARIRQQPFTRVLLKRVSNEILTPNSPSHKKHRLGLPLMPHLPHMPQIHIPFHNHHGSHHSGHSHGGLRPPQHGQHAAAAHGHYHSRRHSSACDELSKRKPAGADNAGTASGGGDVVLHISAGPVAAVAPSEGGGSNNELSNRMADVV